MPITDALVITAIVVVFIAFAAVLAWADYQTRHLSRAVPQKVAQAIKVRSVQSQPATRRK